MSEAMTEGPSKELMDYFKRKEMGQLQEHSDRPEATGWTRGGAITGGALGALGALRPLGMVTGAIGGGILGHLVSTARNKTREDAQKTLALPKRELSDYLQDKVYDKYS